MIVMLALPSVGFLAWNKKPSGKPFHVWCVKIVIGTSEVVSVTVFGIVVVAALDVVSYIGRVILLQSQFNYNTRE